MKTKLIALVAIAAGALAALAEDVAAGQAFELPADQAEQLLTSGQAKLAEEPIAGKGPAADKKVKARVTVDCYLGKCNDLVHISSAEAKQAEADGVADTNKAAVAYAATLEQNQPKG